MGMMFKLGKISSVETTERKDKSGNIVQVLLVNVLLPYKTKDGNVKFEAEDLRLPVTFLNDIQKHIGKYGLFAYAIVKNANGSYEIPKEDILPAFFDKNPYGVDF